MCKYFSWFIYFTQQQCQTAWSAIVPSLQLKESHLCAGGVKGKDACKGDGGLPLIYETNGKYVAAGVVSFGAKNCGTPNVPGVYTNVYQYKTWISSNIIL